MNTKQTRRGFLRTGGAGATLLLLGTRASGRIIGANDRVRIGVAGLNGRGQSHIGGWLDQENVELAYLADPDENVLNRAIAGVSKRTEGKQSPNAVADIRRALEDKSVDAISIATPNHWHSLATIWACQAG
ncbi:MAG: Gfo/Idh/MocA family oxidoreductase, partial [Planctomycetaceae bacterium]|nr:Gfo/Idh/MocA family oxidoreductase [Planctomycetaceae bacterium]